MHRDFGLTPKKPRREPRPQTQQSGAVGDGPLCLSGIPLGEMSVCGGLGAGYQLAFFTPGMRPAEAISRNWMREMPN